MTVLRRAPAPRTERAPAIRIASLCAAVVLCLASCRAAESPASGDRGAGAGPPVEVEDATGGTGASDAPDSAEETDRPDTTAALTAQGWGPLRIGMTRDEVAAAAGADANPGAVGGPDPEACDEFRPSRAPEGMIVMVEDGRLTRISLGAGSRVRTDRGIGVGDRVEAVRAAYGADVESSPHAYWPAPAAYLVVWTTPPPGPDARGVLYEVDAEGRVAHVRAGGPSIEHPEGCV